MVCRAFKKRTMHPPRSVAGAWDPSYPYYHDPVLAGAARFKQESPELDGSAADAASAGVVAAALTATREGLRPSRRRGEAAGKAAEAEAVAAAAMVVLVPSRNS